MHCWISNPFHPWKHWKSTQWLTLYTQCVLTWIWCTLTSFMTNACTWLKLEHNQSVLVSTRKSGFTYSAWMVFKAAYKNPPEICITRTYNIWNTHNGESLSAKAYVQDKPSNKKLVWGSQFHLSAADYNILISVIVSGAKWVSSGWNVSLPNTTQWSVKEGLLNGGSHGAGA